MVSDQTHIDLFILLIKKNFKVFLTPYNVATQANSTFNLFMVREKLQNMKKIHMVFIYVPQIKKFGDHSSAELTKQQTISCRASHCGLC